MQDIVFLSVSAILLAVSFVGCLLPVLPGPAIAFLGVLALLPTCFAPSHVSCSVLAATLAVVMIIDYIVPAAGARRFGCSFLGLAGCVIGTVAGIFFMPFGILVGPFAGAVAGELVSGKGMRAAFKGGFGALAGFLFGSAVKIAYCAACAGWCAVSVLG